MNSDDGSLRFVGIFLTTLPPVTMNTNRTLRKHLEAIKNCIFLAKKSWEICFFDVKAFDFNLVKLKCQLGLKVTHIISLNISDCISACQTSKELLFHLCSL